MIFGIEFFFFLLLLECLFPLAVDSILTYLCVFRVGRRQLKNEFSLVLQTLLIVSQYLFFVLTFHIEFLPPCPGLASATSSHAVSKGAV